MRGLVWLRWGEAAPTSKVHAPAVEAERGPNLATLVPHPAATQVQRTQSRLWPGAGVWSAGVLQGRAADSLQACRCGGQAHMLVRAVQQTHLLTAVCSR